MFVRCKKRGDSIHVQVVKSVRTGDKVRQRVIRHVGTATSETRVDHLKRLGQTIIEEMTQQPRQQTDPFTRHRKLDLLNQQRQATADPDPFGVDLAACRMNRQVSVGIRDAFCTMYSLLGWDRVFGARRMSDNRILREMVLSRIAHPLGRYATDRDIDVRGEETPNFARIHGIMDLLDEETIGKICNQSLAMAERCHGGPISVHFCNFTTLSFESHQQSRATRSPFVFALLVTPEGIPCGYRLFSGSAHEDRILMAVLDGLSRDYPVARLTVVADEEMIGTDNRHRLDERNIPYIIGTGIERENAVMRTRIHARNDFVAWPETDSSDGAIDLYKCIDEDGLRLVVTRSRQRAIREARQSFQSLDRLIEEFEANRRTAPAIGDLFPDLPDEWDEVEEEPRLFGLSGIAVRGLDQLEPEQIVARHLQLREVETGFRANEHDLGMHPAFQWSDRRMRAHVAICYMAYCCIQHLRHRVAVYGNPMSPDAIRRALNALQIQILTETGTGRKFAVPSSISADARRIYRSLGLKWNTAPFLHRTGKRQPEQAR